MQTLVSRRFPAILFFHFSTRVLRKCQGILNVLSQQFSARVLPNFCSKERMQPWAIAEQ